MEVPNAYAYGMAGWLSLQAVPLLLSPKMMVTMLTVESRSPTPLEVYFSRSLAFALFALALLALLLTGSIPLASSYAEAVRVASDPSTPPSLPKDPYAFPTLLLTTTFHSTCTIYGYMQYLKTGQTSFALSVAGYGSLAAMGMWCMLFAGSGHISRRTGADKRTSGWPFKNVEAGKKKVGRERL